MKMRKSSTLQVQTILYNAELDRLKRVFIHLERAANIAIAEDLFLAVNFTIGDCSPTPILSDEDLSELKILAPSLTPVNYTYFNNNIGSAGGHNVLLENIETDFVLIMNPDIMLAPDCLLQLMKPFSKDETTGMVEARQLPIEHPKDYDIVTGETGWATTACALIDARLAIALNGFDSASFFLYCDDVDFSWRARLDGRKVLFQPSAVAYHDKRLSQHGGWAPTMAEQYYSAEAALILAHKYSRPDIVAELLAIFTDSDVEFLQRAAEEYNRRSIAKRLPVAIDAKHQVGSFQDGLYTKHRYHL
jgi:GT2 family glycosyltransferase